MIASEKIIDRAVFIWKKLLENPKFDNGDDSQNGGMAWLLSKMANEKANNTPDKLEAFGAALKKIIMEAGAKDQYKVRFLDVDYHPNEALEQAATESGLDIPVWPCKTTVAIHDGYYQSGQVMEHRLLITSRFQMTCGLLLIYKVMQTWTSSSR